MNSYRIILADDHVLLRQGLKRIVEDRVEQVVVGEAEDGVELLRLMDRTVPDLVILDISMPRMRGLEALCEIKARHPRVKILILTMHKDKEYLRQAYASGADGYLLKEDADTELFSAITAIREGKFYASPAFAKESNELFSQSVCGNIRLAPARERLSVREREILKLIAEGKSSRETAGLLRLSVRTVDHHRASIKSKLNVKKTVELVKFAIEQGYVDDVPR